MRHLTILAGIAAIILPGAVFSSFGAETRHFLHGHVPAAVAHLTPKGDLPATNQLHLAISLPLRNEAALNQLLQETYDPASTNYHRYLTPEQFTAQFGPTEQDYQAVINFARTNGLMVTATYPNRVLVDVAGSAATVGQVFHVTLHIYRHPTENRDFFAPDTEPSVDLGIPISHVSGLDNFLIPRPAIIKKNLPAGKVSGKAAGVAPASGSGPSGLYMGNDFRAAYLPGSTLNGAGQTVGLFELDGYYPTDITKYEAAAGLPNVPLNNVLIDGYSGSAGANNVEVALDIEVAIAMATNLSAVIVYEGQNGGNIVDFLNRIATDNLAKQISSSWLIGDNASYDTAYQQMALQGQSFFQASGDDGAFYPGIPQSADDTNITLVGGTTLSTTGPGGAWLSETVWNWYSTGQGTSGGGGGISLNNLPIPSWQTGIDMTTSQGSTTLRNIPDVALTADNIFVVADNGTNYSVGGTSAAAPLWAGYTALINQQAVVFGSQTVGFINPAIYAIGKGTNYALDFHDITTGNNTNTTVGNNYFAVAGYDLCTGWGTPVGQSLINTFVPLDTLVIAPLNGFNASGLPGGPFSPSSQNFFLTNSDASPLTWSLVNTSAWLSASITGGTLVAAATNGVSISLNAAANSVAVGIYMANIQFTNWNSHLVQTLPFTLAVRQTAVQNGGFETGDFTGWTLNGTGGSINLVAGSSTVAGMSPHSGNYYAALGESGALAYLSQTLPTTPGQLYLVSLWLNSSANPYQGHQTTPNEFNVSWNGSASYDKVNIGKVGWTNLQFVVTATSASTVLQIGARDDPYYLGLDDVTVTPGFAPAISTQPTNLTILSGGNASFSATVTGSTNLAYQWSKNGSSLANSAGIAGATSNVLTLTAVTTNSSGSYSLSVTNIFGAATSSVAVLTVALPPSITASSLTNRMVQCGANTNIFTITAAGSAPLFIQWSTNGVSVNGATNTSFALTNLHLATVTNVAVAVTNLYGGVTNSAIVTVIDTLAPAMMLNGANPLYLELGGSFTDPGATAVDACAGTNPVTVTGAVNLNAVGTNMLTYTADDGNGNTNNVTRTVIVRDTTPPTISWSFTNLVLAANSNCVALMTNVTGTNFITANDLSGALTISQSPTNNSILPLGTNAVLIAVTDASGNTAFSTNTIVVQDQTPPVILSQPQSQTNFAGTAAKFSVAATACTPLTFQWYASNTALTLGTNSTLTLSNVMPAAAGNYFVVAAASGGSSTSAVVTLTVYLPAPSITGVAGNPDGSFTLQLAGLPGYLYVLEATTNLLPPGGWLPVATNTLGTNGVWQFTDLSATNFTQQFYRLKLPP